MVFVDGLGLGEPDAGRNPVLSGACPLLQKLLSEHVIPVDACLGVQGLPQSATGQATLLTGRNAAEFMGRHIEGLPGPKLKELVRESNIFSRLSQRGYSSTFANAYFIDDVEDVKSRRRQSVTTVAALEAFGEVRHTEHLVENKAVYQDLTREHLLDRGYDGPTVTPRAAAEHLVAIAEDHDFTLFEYFQTDLAAHRGDEQTVRRILSNLDQFLGGLVGFADAPDHLFLLTSDHGNIEDATTRTHTPNPVPFVALGAGVDHMRERMKTLQDFVPALLELYPA